MDTQTMMNSRKTVALNLAFEWICPECEIRNFSRGIGVEFDLEYAHRLAGLVGAKEVENLRRAPANVKCLRCGKRYKAEL